jgi:hypothetical protein
MRRRPVGARVVDDWHGHPCHGPVPEGGIVVVIVRVGRRRRLDGLDRLSGHQRKGRTARGRPAATVPTSPARRLIAAKASCVAAAFGLDE